MKLKITITKDCIDNSKRHSGYKCAIANAIRFIFPNAFVWENGIRVNGIYDKINEINLPQKATNCIVAFDLGYELIPGFEFEIDIPDSIVNKINIDELRPLLVNHKNLELV